MNLSNDKETLFRACLSTYLKELHHIKKVSICFRETAIMDLRKKYDVEFKKILPVDKICLLNNSIIEADFTSIYLVRCGYGNLKKFRE